MDQWRELRTEYDEIAAGLKTATASVLPYTLEYLPPPSRWSLLKRLKFFRELPPKLTPERMLRLKAGRDIAWDRVETVGKWWKKVESSKLQPTQVYYLTMLYNLAVVGGRAVIMTHHIAELLLSKQWQEASESNGVTQQFFFQHLELELAVEKYESEHAELRG